jgi:hypothetical protein
VLGHFVKVSEDKFERFRGLILRVINRVVIVSLLYKIGVVWNVGIVSNDIAID